jgi:hypothetical protein
LQAPGDTGKILVENAWKLWLNAFETDDQSQPSIQRKQIYHEPAVPSAWGTYEGNIRSLVRLAPCFLFSILVDDRHRHEQLPDLPYERRGPESLVQTACHQGR